MRFELAAPTGRAAKRMQEATSEPASTLHRLLEYRNTEDDSLLLQDSRFAKGPDNPIDTDVLIVDEMSMVDIMLMDGLLQAIQPGTRLILVGDADQLPSVSAGNVLNDILYINL